MSKFTTLAFPDLPACLAAWIKGLSIEDATEMFVWLDGEPEADSAMIDAIATTFRDGLLANGTLSFPDTDARHATPIGPDEKRRAEKRAKRYHEARHAKQSARQSRKGRKGRKAALKAAALVPVLLALLLTFAAPVYARGSGHSAGHSFGHAKASGHMPKATTVSSHIGGTRIVRLK